MAKVLVIRLSAIGDVAMTVPVIYSAAKANPEDSFTVLTQAFLMPLFMNRPPNVEVIGINTKGAEKGLIGLLKFISALLKFDFDVILDLHNVISTIIICTFFRLNGKRVFVLDKARKERKRLTAIKGKRLYPLRPVIVRYADVFRAAGLNYTETFTSLYEESPAELSGMASVAGIKKGKWIGVAPFAKHRGKIYPVDEMEAILEQWEFQYPRVKSVVGKYALDNELALISQLDVLLCMDSANMHFASLVGTRVISIWGATHPYAGFYGYHQDSGDVIQENLPCRPCSVFGQKPCLRGDWACMTLITPERIVEKVKASIK